MPIDLRSDTVTKPTEAMRAAMAAAEVGDDTFREDLTVLRLEARMAELTGKEAALFVPSGHMGNQICLRAHSQPGDSVICHSGSHIVQYESGALCALSGLQPFTIDSEDGTFTAQHMRARLQPDNIHNPRNRIVALENTHNRCGGTIWPLERLRRVCADAKELGLAVHVDGARLWNACAATGTQPADWLADADSVSMCFSKGLGAPVGSAIAGNRDFIERARFIRKQFGGQMRQAGILAAAALFAIEQHWPRLHEDHENARLLAEMLDGAGPLLCRSPQTNIVMIDIDEDGPAAADLARAVAEDGVLVFAIGERRIRAVTHLDVSRPNVQEAAAAFQRAVSAVPATTN